MEQDRVKDWDATSCGSLALMFVFALILVTGIGWQMFERGKQPENPVPTPQSSAAPRASAAPTSRDYVPGVEPKYVPETSSAPSNANIALARFTVDWDKKTGILRLDASNSTSGYKYVWYFGWSVGKNTGMTIENPMYVTTVSSQQLDNNWATRDITLTLVNSSGQIVATHKEMLP
jgi:hypothetical protein